MIGDLLKRSTEPELMDDPLLEPSRLKKVLKDINNANKLLGGNSITIKNLRRLIKKNPQKSYTIIDMGCGDGAMLREIATYADNNNIDIQLIGIDLSNKAIEISKEASRDFPDIKYIQQDILTLDTTNFTCDILLCTLTMHHFSSRDIPIFLEQFSKLAHLGFIINDLHRNKLACWLYRIFSAIFMKTAIAKYDGLISIKSGFTKKELKNFSNALPSVQHYIKWQWVFRYVWVGQTKRL